MFSGKLCSDKYISTLYEQYIPYLAFQVPNIYKILSVFTYNLLAVDYINTLRAMNFIAVEV
jgi:hypothetical protein